MEPKDLVDSCMSIKREMAEVKVLLDSNPSDVTAKRLYTKLQYDLRQLQLRLLSESYDSKLVVPVLDKCVFNTRGVVFPESKYVSVSKVSGGFLLEFVNNRLVLMDVSPLGFVSIGSKKLGHIFPWQEFTICVNDLDCSGSMHFDIYVHSERTNCVFFPDGSLALNSTHAENGVFFASGCSYSSKGNFIDNGCSVTRYPNLICVSLPGDRKLPINLTADSFVVVGTKVKRHSAIDFLVCVRLLETTPEQVRLKLSIAQAEKLFVFNDIICKHDGCHYGDNFVSMSSIAKSLMLGR